MEKDCRSRYLTTEELTVLLEERRHEDFLRNNRMTWLLGSQGLFFTAFALLFRDFRGPALFISVIGILSCASFGYSLRAAVHGLHELEERMAPLLAQDDLLARASRPGRSTARFPFLYPWNFLPWLFLLVWLFMAAYSVGWIPV